ncbi:hypothetical protein COLO4_19697 [Corchorus olitorius]|uniref:Uncharacterized protein n=1 Tax=Corchorus olitorius TaxID=93759 RepID=A0A1R3J404_9ROSI|nr:hypothetical protein COLO4_19697 [Corchorus olitorius]
MTENLLVQSLARRSLGKRSGSRKFSTEEPKARPYTTLCTTGSSSTTWSSSLNIYIRDRMRRKPKPDCCFVEINHKWEWAVPR